jgi:hypothetical protein
MVGSFSPHLSTGPFIGAIGRPPHPFQPQPGREAVSFSYGVIVTPQDAVPVAGNTAMAPRHSSPVQSDLRDALQQPSRLIQQEQLQKQRNGVSGALQQQQPGAPLCSPQAGGGLIRVAPPVAGTAGLVGSDTDLTQSTPIGQHRMPFTVSRSAPRAEPKSLVAVTTPPTMPPLSSSLPTGESSTTGGPSSITAGALHRPLPTPVELTGPSPLGAADASGGGGSVAGRMEPPRSASAMLSHAVAGATGGAALELFMTNGGVVAPILLPGHPMMHHHPQQQDVAMQRFHPRQPPPPGLVLPFPPQRIALPSLSLQSTAAIIGAAAPSALTDLQQADNLIVNTKQFTDVSFAMC